MAGVQVNFDVHGLGDNVNAIHAFRPWQVRGHDIQVAAGKYGWLWRAAGYTVVPSAPTHPWWEPDPPQVPTDMWSGSKVGRSLMYPAPLPRIAHPRDLWPEVLGSRFDLSACVSQAVRDDVARLLDGLPRPVVAMHTRGVTNPGGKNFPADLERHVIDALAAIGGVILLDHGGDGPAADHPTVRRATGYDVERLYALIDAADVLVGIDSGPFHLARMTSTPRVGCWWGVTPYHACLPLDNDINLFGPHELNPMRGEHFRVREVSEIGLYAVVRAVLDQYERREH